MKEVKFLSVILMAILTVLYFDSQEETVSDTVSEVTIAETDPSDITGLTLVTRTQTITMSMKKDTEGEQYPWFRIESKSSTRAFVASDKTEKLVGKYARLKAIRSLGKNFSPEEIASLKLKSPMRRLVIKQGSGEKTFELGGRTHGARDHYIRAKGGSEIYLIAKKTIADLESPEAQLMQRKVISAKLEDVSSALISNENKTIEILRKNRLSKKDAFWASKKEPEQRNETLGNYMSKLLSSTARSYGSREKPLKSESFLLRMKLLDESGDVIDELEVSKGATKRPSYLVKSKATRQIAEIRRTLGEQLEQDLSTVLNL